MGRFVEGWALQLLRLGLVLCVSLVERHFVVCSY